MPAGRPTKIQEKEIKKLEEAFAIGCNDRQACLFAGITPQVYYPYIKKHPELLDRFRQLKEKPILKARKTIFDNLNDPKTAQWYLEKKQRDEFGSNFIPVDDDEGKPLFQVNVTLDDKSKTEPE